MRILVDSGNYFSNNHNRATGGLSNDRASLEPSHPAKGGARLRSGSNRATSCCKHRMVNEFSPPRVIVISIGDQRGYFIDCFAEHAWGILDTLEALRPHDS